MDTAPKSEFAKLLDELGARLDRRTQEAETRGFIKAFTADCARGVARMTAATTEMSSLAGSLAADRRRRAADRRERIVKSFADLNARATEAAAAGRLSAEEAAKLDVMLGRVGERVVTL